MERYVVSRELAEKMKAAGYRVLTQYAWQDNVFTGGERQLFLTNDLPPMKIPYQQTYAPLSDELLEQLPKNIDTVGYLLIENGYGVGYAQYGEIRSGYFGYKKLADSLAELWLWCKQNDYIKEEN